MPAWKKVIVSGSDASLNSLNVTNGVTGSLFGTSSYSNNTDLLDGKDSSTFATTGSNTFRGNQTVTGSLFTTGSNTLVGFTTLTGSLLVSGSTTQVGNNILLGNTTLSGSITISGSSGPGSTSASVQIYGDIRQTGYHRFDPVTTNIDPNISASYIFVSGSTNDLYFSQNGAGYVNVTRLRWIEGTLFTGLLHGGVISASNGSTTYYVSSGSGIIVDLNGSLSDDPYPTVQYLTWGNLSASIAPLTSSYDQSFIGIDNTNNIFAQGTPFFNGQYDTLIPLGIVLHQNRSTINGSKSQPSLAYGWKQRSNVFIQAFGPLKLSGLTLYTSSSLGLTIGSGTAYLDGANYPVDPNNPSYITDAGTAVSKIFRYWQSGSNGWVYDTNGGAGYTSIDPTQYVSASVLTTVPVPAGSNWTIQRVFWFPASVSKAIVVYYGNAVYASELDAIANINVESFIEAPNTAANAVYVGAIICRRDVNFITQPTYYKLIPGGLFRSVGGSGGGGSAVTQTLSGLSDVLIPSPLSGQALVYDSTAAKWENKSYISASISGNATSATTAATASSADNFTVRGTLTAQTIVAQTITSSTDYVTGSTRFGSLLTDTHQFTGSVSITGSFNTVGTNYLGGNTYVTGGNRLSVQGDDFQEISITSNADSTYFIMNAYAASLTGSDVATSEKYLDGYVTYDRVYFSGSTYGIIAYPNIPEVNANRRGTVELWLPTTNTTGSFNIVNYNPTSNSLVKFLSSNRTLFNNAVDNGINTVQVSGSILANSFTGSLFGTASWANNATSASFAPTATNVYIQGGNSFGAAAVLGTNDVQDLQFETSGSIRMTISGSNGNVGIGTTTPAYKLDVNGEIRAKTDAFIHNSAGEARLEIGRSSAGARSVLFSDSTAGLIYYEPGFSNYVYYYSKSTDSLLFQTNGSDRLTINSNGNVGIGTTSPSAKLEVSGSGYIIKAISTGADSAYLQAANGSYSYIAGVATSLGNGYMGMSSNHPLAIVTNGAERMRVTADGNVGIGTTSPVTKLEVYNATEDRHFLAVGAAPSINFGNTNSGPSYYGTVGLATATNNFIQGAIAGDLAIVNRGNISGSILFGIGASSTNERMRITPAGNVGIGTSNPSNKFVVSNAGASGFEINPTGGVSSGVLLQAYNRSTSAYMAQSYYALSHTFNVGSGGGTRALDIDSTGNVGIGTTSPTTRLHIVQSTSFDGIRIVSSNGTTQNTLALYHNDSYAVVETTYLGSGAFKALCLNTQGGNVGIGTTTPSATLHVNGVVSIGATSVSSEGSLFLGPKNTTEGGQIFFQAGTSYTSASMLDVYNDGANPYFRILRGTNVGSDAIVAQFNLHTKQFFLPSYNSTSSFAGTAAAYLAVNSNGDVITVAGTGGGGSVSGGSTNYIARWASSTTLTTGSLYDNGTNVGIGTTTPSARLHTYIGTSTAASASNAIGIFESNVNGVVQINGPDANSMGLFFGRSGAAYYSGIERNGTDLYLKNNSSVAVTINSSGNVGIGTTSPDSKFHVGPSNGSQIRFDFVGSGDNYYDGVTHYFRNGNGASNIMTLLNGGSVGIGTTAPSTKLYVNAYDASNWITTLNNTGTSGHQMYFGYNDGSSTRYGLYIAGGPGSGTGNFDFGVGSSKFRIMADGNVGIGTSSPTRKLDVNGTSIFRDFTTVVASNGNTVSNITWLSTDSGIMNIYTGGSATVQLNSNGVSYFNGGNVGINTTSPQDKLTVRGATNYNLNLGMLGSYSAIYVYNDASNAYKELRIDAAPLILQSYSGGNVGINTTAPVAKLDVEGDFQLLNANYNSYSSSVSGTTTLATIPTSSYNGVFFDFVAFSGSNQRAGTLIGNWRSGTVQYTEYSTPDIGSTAAAVTMSVTLSGANALVQSVSAPGWAIKATYRTV